MKLLTTGAKGFIGSNIYAHLKQRNYHVTGVSRGDVIPSEIFGIVIHCAGVTPSKNPLLTTDMYVEDNINYTLSLLKTIKHKAFIFLSTIMSFKPVVTRLIQN